MKNFPHQVADLKRLTEALMVVAKMLDKGSDPASNEELGSALAHAGVYTFSGGLSASPGLAAEKQKTVANRGSQTAAPDLRRMLTLCGFVEKAGNTIKVTKVGTAVVKGTGLARDYAWRSALLALELPGTNGSSHPYRILLRLVSEFPGIEKKKLALALEADNDSETEFQRITKLTTLPFDQLLEQTGATEAHAANAIKILPSIAEQLGDVRRDGQKAYPRSKFNVTEDGTEFEHGPLATPPKINLTPDTSAPDPTFQGSSGTKVDLSAAIEFRKLRTLDHQRTVRALAKDYVAQAFRYLLIHTIASHPREKSGF